MTKRTLRAAIWMLPCFSPLQKEPTFLLLLLAANDSYLNVCSQSNTLKWWHYTPQHVKSVYWSEKTQLFLQKLLRYPAGPHWAVSIFRSHCCCRKEQPQLLLMSLKQDFQTHFIQRAHWEHTRGCHCPQHTDVATSLERRDLTRHN